MNYVSYHRNIHYEKCPYLEFFWSVFCRIWTEYGEILRISPLSVRMRQNKNQKNSVNWHFSRSDMHLNDLFN